MEPSVQGSMAWPARKNMNSNIRVCRMLQINDKRCLGRRPKRMAEIGTFMFESFGNDTKQTIEDKIYKIR